jgi:hypothetical protein
MENVGIFLAHLKYTMTIWYILRPFGKVVAIFPRLVNCIKKNLATLGTCIIH